MIRLATLSITFVPRHSYNIPRNANHQLKLSTYRHAVNYVPPPKRVPRSVSVCPALFLNITHLKVQAKYGGGDGGGGSDVSSSSSSSSSSYNSTDYPSNNGYQDRPVSGWFVLAVLLVIFGVYMYVQPTEEASYRAAQHFLSNTTRASDAAFRGKKKWLTVEGTRVTATGDDSPTLIFRPRTLFDLVQHKYVDVTAQLDFPLDPEHGLAYFEVFIEKMPNSNGTVAIGVAPRPWPHWRLPGWHASSMGLHGDDGHLFIEDPGHGMPYGEKFKQGDTIGCGLTRDGSYVFILNGKPLAKTQFKPNRTVYPIVGADCGATLRTSLYAQTPV